MNQGLWTAVVAAGAAIASALLNQLLTSRREGKLWKQRQLDKVWELQVALYVELAGYCQRRLRFLQDGLAVELLPDGAVQRPPGFAGFGSLDGSEQRDLFLARTELLGPDAVSIAFRKACDTEMLIEWAVDNDGVGTNITDYGVHYFPPDNEYVERLHEQLDQLAAALRAAIRRGGV